MTVSVVFAIAGVIALLFGVIGGGIKAKEVEVPLLPTRARIITATIGLILLGITLWLENDKKIQAFPLENTSQVTLSPSPFQQDTVQADISQNAIFTLTNAKPEDFYTIQNATFVLRSDGNLAVTGSYAQGTYLNQSLPNSFRARVQFRTEHPEDQFILGLSDGKEMRPNYHFVMTPKWTAFKQQQGFDVTDNWDKELKHTEIAAFLIRPDVTYEVIFERKSGGVNVFINNVFVFGFGTQDVSKIGKFNFLYFTGAQQQQIIIDGLVIEDLE